MTETTETAPAEETRKPHFSVSQITMALECGEAWRRRYEEHEIIPPGFALIRGSSVHTVAEVNLKQKLESRVDLPVRDLVDIAAADFEARRMRGVSTLSNDPRTYERAAGEELDSTVRLARLHALKQAPEYQPVVVEEAVRIVLPERSRDLVVVLDVVNEDGAVRDFKTSRRRKPENEADRSIQLTAYSFARSVMTGGELPPVGLDVAVDTGTNQSRQLLTSVRTPKDLEAFEQVFGAVEKMVTAGVFPPAAPGSWKCCPEYCGYFADCKFVTLGAGRSQGD